MCLFLLFYFLIPFKIPFALVQLPSVQLIELRNCTLNGEDKAKKFCNMIVAFQKSSFKAGIELQRCLDREFAMGSAGHAFYCMAVS